MNPITIVLVFLASTAFFTAFQKENAERPSEAEVKETTKEAKIFKEESKQINALHVHTQNAEAIDFLLSEASAKKTCLIGFPGCSDPYKDVPIFSSMENYRTSTNQFVNIHEIGHSLGLRRTD